VSTVPTNTNGTDYTNNTMATSLDETPEFIKHGAAVASGSFPSKNYEDGYAVASPANTGPDLSLPKRDRVAAIDMKIPGRYPPTNVAA
jgi:hypothetical protein